MAAEREHGSTDRTVAAMRAAADRTAFALGSEAVEAWEAVNRRPARELLGLRRFMDRPSPFAAG